jgi:hypothetical protein
LTNILKLALPAALAVGIAVPAVTANAGVVRVATPAIQVAPHIMLPRGAVNPNRRSSNLIYHGGPILKTPIVYVTYWGWTSDPMGEQPYLQAFLSGVGGTSWINSDTQYYSTSQGNITNPTGQLGGVWSDNTDPLPSHPTDAQVSAEANRAASHFGTNSNASYVIATPTGHSTSGFGTQWCAYHGYSGSVSYTNLPYMTDAGSSCGKNIISGPLDGVSIVEGHEYAESQTDPKLNAWYNSGGSENGDLCAWRNITVLSFSTGNFAVQPLWSNASSSCVLSY